LGAKWTNEGYIMIYAPDHPNAKHNGGIYEYRYIMSQFLDRPLKPSEIIHHVNGDRQDNRIENLKVVEAQKGHFLAHHPEYEKEEYRQEQKRESQKRWLKKNPYYMRDYKRHRKEERRKK
jgi:hypothetical protein